MITLEQRQLVDKLHNEEITLTQFNGMRSNARNHNNIERSLLLACVYEIYKQEIKCNGK